MHRIPIKSHKQEPLPQFLENHGFSVEIVETTTPEAVQVIRAQRHNELPVFLHASGNQIFFETDLGNIDAFADVSLLADLLELNTEILPASIGFDCSNPADRRLVLVESRETGDLSDEELLAVFDAFELATDRVRDLLAPKLQSA